MIMRDLKTNFILKKKLLFCFCKQRKKIPVFFFFFKLQHVNKNLRTDHMQISSRRISDWLFTRGIKILLSLLACSNEQGFLLKSSSIIVPGDHRLILMSPMVSF